MCHFDFWIKDIPHRPVLFFVYHILASLNATILLQISCFFLSLQQMHSFIDAKITQKLKLALSKGRICAREFACSFASIITFLSNLTWHRKVDRFPSSLFVLPTPDREHDSLPEVTYHLSYFIETPCRRTASTSFN